VLVGIIVTVLGLGLFQAFFFPWMWQDSPVSVIVFATIEVIVCSVAVAYAAMNIAKRQEFVCRITDGRIECLCPVSGCGESFVVRIDAIVKIEKERWEDSVRWYLWDNEGQRHWLTSNYDNPVEDFIEVIKRLNSRVVEVDT
jgi:hypothetical protein